MMSRQMARVGGVRITGLVGLGFVAVAAVTTVVVIDLVGPITPPDGCDYPQGGAIIEWVDFVKFDRITYYADYYYEGAAEEHLVGPVYRTVKCKLSDNVSDPGYEPRNGDAAFLEPGASVYLVKGYDATFRLAAESAGRLRLYEAESNPSAEVGVDLLDIRDKVTNITVRSRRDGKTVIGEISEASEVDRLVEMVLEAPVDQDLHSGGGRFLFVRFELVDRTASVRALDPSTNILDRGILVPEEFTQAIHEALED